MNKMEGPTYVQEKKWTYKRMNRKGNIKFLNSFQSQKAYQIMKREDLMNRRLA